MTDDDRAWIELVKRTRVKFEVGLDEAHRIILADPEMRRLVAWRVNHNAECRKLALANIRRDGDASLFVSDAGTIRLR